MSSLLSSFRAEADTPARRFSNYSGVILWLCRDPELPLLRDFVSNQALRCGQCNGELKFCPSCKGIVGMTSKQMSVGLARGG